MRFLVILWFAATGSALAGEYAVLASGSRLHIERHETAGDHVRLFLGGGSIEMGASEVAGFEPDPDEKVASPAPAAVVAPHAPTPLTPQQLADAAAQKYGLPPSLVRSVMKAESAFRAEAVSSKGAIGLMQLMPATAETFGANPLDPAQNVDAGARYLRDLLEKYNGGLRHALAAYNAGPGAVEHYRGVPPFPETIDYIRRIERDWNTAPQP
jgi:soluble lytic murein transglycosylase-like protein